MSPNIHVNPEKDFLNFLYPYEETESSVTVSKSGKAAPGQTAVFH